MTTPVQVEAPAQAPEVHVEAVFERLPVDPFTACDGHASQAIQALVTMLTGKGAIVYLCGNCARKAGFEHTKDAPVEDRAKGSDH